MALVTDKEDGVQRAAEEYNDASNRTGLAKQAWNAGEAAAEIDSAECAYCRHHHCRICDECSVAKPYSDYWICHQCGELNRRASNCP